MRFSVPPNSQSKKIGRRALCKCVYYIAEKHKQTYYGQNTYSKSAFIFKRNHISYRNVPFHFDEMGFRWAVSWIKCYVKTLMTGQNEIKCETSANQSNCPHFFSSFNRWTHNDFYDSISIFSTKTTKQSSVTVSAVCLHAVCRLNMFLFCSVLFFVFFFAVLLVRLSLFVYYLLVNCYNYRTFVDRRRMLNGPFGNLSKPETINWI